MNTLILLAACTLGVDYTWERLPDGQFEYVVQIEPEVLSSLEDGLAVTSDLPPGVRGAVRRVRIVVGRDRLPRPADDPPPADVEPAPFELLEPERPIQPASADEPADRNDAARSGDDAGSSTGGPANGSAGGGGPASPSEQRAAAGAGAIDGGSDGSPRPWIWLSVALVALFASLGANVFQGWMSIAIRRRYRDAIDRIVVQHG